MCVSRNLRKIAPYTSLRNRTVRYWMDVGCNLETHPHLLDVAIFRPQDLRLGLDVQSTNGKLVGGFNSTHWKNLRSRQNGFIFPRYIGVKIKKCLSCHHVVNCWFGAPVVWIPGIRLRKGLGFLGVPLESQTIKPNQQLTIS